MSSEKDTLSKLGDRIAKVRKEQGFTQSEMAEEIGVSQQTLGHYERGSRRPQVETLQQIGVQYEVNLDWLLLGQGDMDRGALSEEKEQKPYVTENLPDDFDPDSVSFVPVYGAPLGAGSAGNASMVKVRGYMAWEKKWLRREARIDPQRAFVAQVFGQSMEEILENGDLVLGEARTEVDHDGIYAIRWGDELYIKHVIRERESLRLVSENDVYGSTEIGKHEDFSVIGRIVVRVGAV